MFGNEVFRNRIIISVSHIFRLTGDQENDGLVGDIKAARLYFEVLGNIGKSNLAINTQNNYIQINQTKLSQEIIKQLSPEQLDQIEAVLQSVSNVIT